MIAATVGSVPSAAAVAEAVRVLSEGRPVGIPTDTVYGLAVDPFRPGATDRVFAAKRRPRERNLPVLVADVAQALALAGPVPDGAVSLMGRFWPGALTIVVRARPGLGADLGDDDATVGVRCPANTVARALCAAAGPLATTSANVHGGAPLVTAAEVAAAFGEAVPVVLDGGACTGLPSTVVDCTTAEPRLLRRGGVDWDEVRAELARR